ncbi:MAG: LTA synthase family protein [candidate division Zixibacteria bacterium]|nr:LTA synthase family protein [candidate division Zixibacteria bacterium]MDH3936933.1 LTA synthase family protein [candidate division Zixibacteria bacterium]MDH4032762.1 LTA synthase family protein [candidate division Zixibacteria bacterium]
MNRAGDRTTGALAALLPSRSFVQITLCYLLTLVFFAILRLIFLLHFSGQVAGESLGEILAAFMVGLRFDQIIILYCLLPLLLVTPWLNSSRRWFRLTIGSYLCVVFGVVFILLLSDIRFYANFGSHLNFLFYEYIDEGGIFWSMVFSDSGFTASILIWIVLTVLFAYLIMLLMRKTDGMPNRRSWVGQVGWTVVFLALFFLGIRGRTGLAPIDWGEAYFSHNAFLNQLALNGVYTLARNYTERDGDLRLSTMTEQERFPFVETAEAGNTLTEMMRRPNEVWTDRRREFSRSTISARVTPAPRVNVIIVLLESWAARNTGVLGSKHDLTPHFDSAAGRGTLFTHFFANGIRTSFGLPAVLGSYPSLPGRSIMGRYDAPHPFSTVSEILHQRGYFNAFVYGGDLAFDNIEGFFTNKQYDRFVGEKNFAGQQTFSKWGVPDHVLFERAAALIDSLPRPFQMTVLTSSNHEPFDLPDSSVQMFFDDADSSKLFNAQLYADKALGLFLKSLEEKRVFDSAIVVLTADHARYDVSRLVLDPETFRIPLLILGPQGMIQPGRVIDAAGSQVDILPTILDLLGGKYTHRSWGRDVLSLADDDPGFAMINAGDRIGCVTRDYFYLEWLGRQTSLYMYDSLGDNTADISQVKRELFAKLQKRTRAYMQLAEQLSQVETAPPASTADSPDETRF